MPAGGPTFASGTVGERGANPKGVERVHREALICAWHMVEERDARGANLSRSSVKVKDHVIYLLGGKTGLCTLHEASTGLCKAHGGGERCSWGQPESEFGRGEGPCNLFARGNMGLCLLHGYLVPDKRVSGGAILGP